MEDQEIRKRLNHMAMAYEMLQALARGEMSDPAGFKERESAEELEAAMGRANQALVKTVELADLEKTIGLPRGCGRWAPRRR
jgi:hypothetical protein